MGHDAARLCTAAQSGAAPRHEFKTRAKRVSHSTYMCTASFEKEGEGG